MMSDEIRKEFASSILISDINAYVDTHKLEYEEWLKKRKKDLESKSKKKVGIKNEKNRNN